MEKVESNAATPYPIYFADVSRIEDLLQFQYPSRHFVLLLCADYEKVTEETIKGIANDLIEKGNIYFCAWGQDSGKAHMAFDLKAVERDLSGKEDLHCMTTWHEGESLEDALWFVLFAAMVSEGWDSCSTIIVTVGNPNWKERIKRHLSDIRTFSTNLLEKEAL